MEYNKVIAVTGLPGLYELLSSKADGAIVRALDDKTTRFVSSRIHNFSHLESIEVYTVRDNVNLVDVLKAMDASSEKLPDDKDNSALKNYFGKVYPDLDFDRVYSSDLKKMVKWFSVLKANNIEIKLSEAPEEEAGEAEVEVVEEEVKEKSAPKKKAAEKAETTAKKSEEKPAAKKEAKAEVEEEKPKAKKSAAPKSEEKAAPKKKAEKAEEGATAEKPKKAPAKKK
jgi:hypothetical protein